MGEIADMMIEGFLDSETGEVIDGDAPGYPRTMKGGGYGQRIPKTKTCPECKKRFRGKIGLRDHRRMKHGIQ